MGNNHGWYINEIIIDSHEKIRGHNAYNYYIDNYHVKIEPLEFGDYLFKTSDGKEIIFEYKTTNDFISSMENTTLFNEVSNQTTQYEYSYLIISGDFNKTYDNLYFSVSKLRYKYKTIHILRSSLSKQVTGALNRIYAMYVPIIFVDDEKEAFEKMLQISSKIADTKKYGGIVRPNSKGLIKNSSSIFLTTIKGIGNKKAENITNELGINCLDDLCEKTPSDFLSVNRVTEENVREIWRRIHNEELKMFMD